MRAYDLNSRLYVELAPDEASRVHVATLAKGLKAHVSGRFVSQAKWHVTVIHFGKVRDVYNYMQAVLPGLSEASFLQALERYAEQSKTVLPYQISLKTTGYELFGGRRSVLALRLEKSPDIEQAHLVALSYLLEFFRACGLHNPEEFMRGNHNFQHAFDIKPHLTLMRNVNRANLAELPKPAQQLRFLPAGLAGL